MGDFWSLLDSDWSRRLAPQRKCLAISTEGAVFRCGCRKIVGFDFLIYHLLGQNRRNASGSSHIGSFM